MTRSQFLLTACSPFLCRSLFAARKKSKSKTPELDVKEAAALRHSDRIELDVRVQNVSERPLRGLKLFFEITDADNRVLSRQTMEVEDDELPVDGEHHFAGQIQPHARAVSFRIYFEDTGENEILATKTGPFAIE
jgi:hypothetical protein